MNPTPFILPQFDYANASVTIDITGLTTLDFLAENVNVRNFYITSNSPLTIEYSDVVFGPFSEGDLITANNGTTGTVVSDDEAGTLTFTVLTNVEDWFTATSIMHSEGEGEEYIETTANINNITAAFETIDTFENVPNGEFFIYPTYGLELSMVAGYGEGKLRCTGSTVERIGNSNGFFSFKMFNGVIYQTGSGTDIRD